MTGELSSTDSEKLTTIAASSGYVRKEYVARCKGEYPEGEVVCEEPLLTVDRQMGLNPKGERIRYGSNTDGSVVLCKPLTGHSELQTSKKLLPRETGEDIGMGSPVPLSSEAVDVITRLRNMKDEAEDWSQWRDMIFRAKESLKAPRSLEVKKPPPNNRRRKNKGEFVDQSLNDAIKALNMSSPEAASSEVIDSLTSEVNTRLEVEAVPAASDPSAGANSNTVEAEKKPIQISTAEAIEITRSIISETDGVKICQNIPEKTASNSSTAQ
ncbi:hypothetical protein K435DRAFT_812863 [Dendrothele bispora CBS 962.96]|uniref:Uncharacterized protein n=1 Tax=Dendrothele bispora (strain CBS 962.96) TaxID=1314807 RepID=A0A4S8KNB7_DENBC|nr:hypothetical protein K435DRAFT_812863 [Dendrothele bispora CBS 962.96]